MGRVRWIMGCLEYQAEDTTVEPWFIDSDIYGWSTQLLIRRAGTGVGRWKKWEGRPVAGCARSLDAPALLWSLVVAWACSDSSRPDGPNAGRKSGALRKWIRSNIHDWSKNQATYNGSTPFVDGGFSRVLDKASVPGGTARSEVSKTSLPFPLSAVGIRVGLWVGEAA